ncbi:glucokinase [Leptolyngbya sp. NK1-12]|uniref:Glucokinase n=1 Tax=Leptolyngbya sp. NK1-12 TaxID=2547451 RepID=A0AA96WSI1_9CYAN|nr:glucokinase [Leptolyngbya sp. NK1-12]WNZ21972.1 glucokinase [Leptolyngbya sp. NK1-12]
MTQLLAGDTGGTKTILRLAEASPSETGIPKLTTLYERRFISAEFVDLVPLVRKFLTEAAVELGYMPAPEKACFSIAGPVINNTCNLTNLSWFLDGARLQRDLGIARVELLNDFGAVGHGIAGLEPSDLYTLQEGELQRHAPIAVIGAGTGLGEGFLIPVDDQYRVFGTEGGHTDFAPRSELEFQLLKYLRDKLSLSRISVERVVSGMGIVAIYQFLRDRQAIGESPEVASAIRTWEGEAGLTEKSIDPAAVIAVAAAEQQDPLCKKTMELFAELYGAEAGNLALKLLPYGGLYIAGGVAAKNLPLLKSGIFIKSMNDKGRMRPLMERIPVHVILNQNVGLIGASLYALKL